MRRILIGACAMMATTAMTNPHLCAIDDGMNDGDQGGGSSGGVNLDKSDKIDDSGAGDQAQQQMDLGEQQAADDTAGKQADQAADGSKQQGDDADSDLADAGKQEGDTAD